jgi:hypothetical protein
MKANEHRLNKALADLQEKEPCKDFQKEVGEWGDRTFNPDGHNVTTGIICHLEKEVDELQQTANPTEAADCYILLLQLAHNLGFNLEHEARLKMKINYKRKWDKPDKFGVVEHIKEPCSKPDQPDCNTCEDEKYVRKYMDCLIPCAKDVLGSLPCPACSKPAQEQGDTAAFVKECNDVLDNWKSNRYSPAIWCLCQAIIRIEDYEETLKNSVEIVERDQEWQQEDNAEIAQLRKDLKWYGMHRPRCNTRFTIDKPFMKKCDCGYEQALQPQPKSPPSSEKEGEK